MDNEGCARMWPCTGASTKFTWLCYQSVLTGPTFVI